MKSVGGLALTTLAFLAMANLNFVNAQAPQPAAQVGEESQRPQFH
jgi:hypothetical protein